jgi:RNA polymerase sigma-70 factor (ECF subfamily)
MTDTNYESVLMRRVSGGDREGFEELVRLYSNRLLTFLHRMNGDFHQSEELFQEVFLTVWRRRHTYKFPGPVRPWLYKIALNVSRASWRKARLPMENIDGIENLARTLSDEPAGRAMDKELVSVASEAVLDLPTQQKTVFAFRIWNEMTYREIAETMELSEATVRSHMHHALRSLRQQLAPRMSND